MNSDRTLVQECISGNRAMQNQLYARFAPAMFGVCLRYSKNRHDAEEILQESFIRVFTCLCQYKFKGPLKAWIKRIVVNCALQNLRSKNSLYPIISYENVSEEITEKELILDGINTKELLSVVQNLPVVCRLVFNLYVFENMKHREIAKLLDISEGTSKSNLHDARMLLQRRLTGQNVIANVNSTA